jgi:cytidyltransferase-like protein
MKIIVVSGGFDPVHSGHIEYFKHARELGDKLFVALNSDNWLINKKGKFFMPFEERKAVIEHLRFVDSVISFEDDNQGSAANALLKVKEIHPDDQIVFANGGDRTQDNIPEMSVEGIEFLFGIGGDYKKNSSSWILKKWKYPEEVRVWGTFYDLFQDKHAKVKELVVNPMSGMSFQRHFKRSEIWLINKGRCIVNYSKADPEHKKSVELKKFDHFIVNLGDWHQITNPFNEECRIIEIQYGEATIEEDIERLYHYNDS